MRISRAPLCAGVWWLVLLVLSVWHSAQASPAFSGGAAMRNQARITSGAMSRQANKALIPRMEIDSKFASPVMALDISANNASLVVLNEQGQLHLWRLAKGEKRPLPLTDKQGIRSARVSHDGRTVAMVNGAGQFYLADVITGQVTRKFADIQRVEQVYKSGDSWLLLSKDRNVFIIKQEANAIHELKTGITDKIVDLQVDTNGDIGISTDTDLYRYDGKLLTLKEKLHQENGFLFAESRAFRAVCNGKQVRIMPVQAGATPVNFSLRDKGHNVMQVSPDGRQLALAATDGSVSVLEVASGREQQLGVHEGAVSGMAFSEDGGLLFTAGQDQMVRVWNTKQRAEALRLVSLHSGWAVVAPSGHFDGNFNGDEEDRARAIKWAAGGEQYGLDGFIERYYVPGLLARLVKNGTLSAVAQAAQDLSHGFSLPPTVAIQQKAVSASSINMTVSVEERDGGLGELRFYHNGKRITGREIPAVASASVSQQAVLPVIAGDNEYKVVAFSREGVESEPAVYQYQSGVKAGVGRLHVLVIGINHYKNSFFNLNFSVPDGLAIRDYMATNNHFFETVRTHSLFDQNASTTAISQAMGGLDEIAPEDTVMIYFAGHGTSVADTWYFVPYELEEPYDEGALRSGGVSSDVIQKWVSQIRAQKVVLLIDACNSGAVVDAFSEFRDRRPILRLARSAGVHIAAAASRDQQAAEIEQLGHGLFTYTLMGALSGRADVNPAEGLVSVAELLEYVRVHMPMLSEQYRVDQQVPVLNSQGGDFTIKKLGR